MFRNIRSSLIAAALALAALVPAGQSIAAPVAVPQPAVAADSALVVQVRDGWRHGPRHGGWHRWDRRDRWDRGWHRGWDRPRYYRPRYAPPPVYRGPVRSGSAHIRWCESRYRTYRAWDNTYSRDIGVRVQCISPYI